MEDYKDILGLIRLAGVIFLFVKFAPDMFASRVLMARLREHDPVTWRKLGSPEAFTSSPVETGRMIRLFFSRPMLHHENNSIRRLVRYYVISFVATGAVIAVVFLTLVLQRSL